MDARNINLWVVPANAGTHSHSNPFEAPRSNQQIAGIPPPKLIAFDRFDLPVRLPPFWLFLASNPRNTNRMEPLLPTHGDRRFWGPGFLRSARLATSRR